MKKKDIRSGDCNKSLYFLNSVLILGENTKHANLFRFFSEKVILAIDKQNIGKRPNDEINDYILLDATQTRKGVFRFLKRIRFIKKAIKTNNINVVFSNRKDDMVCAKIASMFIKYKPILLVTFHNSLAFVNGQKVKMLVKMVNLCSDGFICLANSVLKMFVEFKANKDKILYLPNSIDCSQIIQKEHYLFKNNICKIVSCGVINNNKNQLMLVELVGRLSAHHNVEAHIIGDFEDEKYLLELKKRIEELNLSSKVFLYGKMDNIMVKHMLADFDIFVSTSKMEMSPYSILEAKAAGLPIVASKAFGQQDLIKDGVDGYLFEDDDVVGAYNKISVLINDIVKRESFGKAARQSIEETNSCQKSAEKLKLFIEKLKLRG